MRTPYSFNTSYCSYQLCGTGHSFNMGNSLNSLNCFNTTGEKTSQLQSAPAVEEVREQPNMGNSLNGFKKSIEKQSGSAPAVEEEGESPVPESAPAVVGGGVSPVPESAPAMEEVGEQRVPGSAPAVEEVEDSATTVKEVTDSLQIFSDPNHLITFADKIGKLLEEKKSDKASTSEGANEKSSMWTSFIQSGAKFLKFANDHIEKIGDREDVITSEHSTVVAEILGLISHLHWAVGGLAIIAYVIEKFNKVSANREDALELLSQMFDLLTAAIKLKNEIDPDKLNKVVMQVVQGSIICVSQIQSEKFFRFFKTSIDSDRLKKMSTTIDHLYRDLDLSMLGNVAEAQVRFSTRQSIHHSEISIHQSKMEESQSKMAESLPRFLPVQKPHYPEDAVGIENARDTVTELLNMTTEDESTLVVVIYGFGGIGKTTLANAVVAGLNLGDYNYARIQLEEDNSENHLRKLQQLILKDAFPSFHPECTIKLRDCQEGRDRLKEAFKLPGNKPIFLFMDNALSSQDLRKLLPDNLTNLPKRSRILLTTRNLKETHVFGNSGLKCLPFLVKILENDDAVKILCKNADNCERINGDMERILRICGGVPLALTIVGRHLVEMEYNAGNCSQILQALEQGGDVKEESLSGRVIKFVYDRLEQGTQDAFLDICCFFNGCLRRHVEYVVGERQVKLLEEAALLIPFLNTKDTYGIEAGEERIKVHDIARAQGQAMSAFTRFTDVESFLEMAQDKSKLNGIKGLWFPEGNSKKQELNVDDFNLMRRSLRIMHLGWNTKTSMQSREKFKELRYLQVPKRIGCLPIKVEELDVLGTLEGTTKGVRINQCCRSLRKIESNQTGAFAAWEESSSAQGIQNHFLKELHLWGLDVMQLSEEIHQLSSLQILSLSWFNKMEEFPEQVRELSSSLIKLRIQGWVNLKRLPEWFGLFENLTHLEIVACFELEELPSSFGELPALKHLNLSHCRKLKHLPDGLPSLKYLDVSCCEQLSMESYESRLGLSIERNADKIDPLDEIFRRARA